jgi:hypothetical protein
MVRERGLSRIWYVILAARDAGRVSARTAARFSSMRLPIRDVDAVDDLAPAVVRAATGRAHHRRYRQRG